METNEISYMMTGDYIMFIEVIEEYLICVQSDNGLIRVYNQRKGCFKIVNEYCIHEKVEHFSY